MRYIPYEEYFGAMALSEEQKSDRINLARALEQALLYTVTLVSLQVDNILEFDTLNMLEAENEAFKGVVGALQDTGIVVSDYYIDYARKFVQNFLDTTYAHLGEAYYLSLERVRYNAENEANTIMNHSEYDTAIRLGYKRKRWIDMDDRRERLTHIEVDKDIYPIDKPYQVGLSLMQYPKDESLGATEEEIINCRCSIEYLR
jgi:hypothetical protein